MELTTRYIQTKFKPLLFMITKIQNLNGTHNGFIKKKVEGLVVYDYKDTKFEWNSQQLS